MNLQTFIIRYATSIIWRLSPERKIRALRSFSMVEKDSACRFMKYVTILDKPELKKDVFQHALEEFHHSSMFDQLVKQLNNTHVNIEVNPKKFLIQEDASLSDVIEAYAYAHVGEEAINKNFWAYNNPKFERIVRSVFAKISIDEKRHAEASDDVLLTLCQGDMRRYNQLCRQAKRKRWYEEYSVVMKRVGEFQLNLVLGLVYFIVGPLVTLTLKSRLDFSKEKQLKVFKEQIKDLEDAL